MKPLIVLLIVFCLSLIGTKFFQKKHEIAKSARIAIAAMLLFTGAGHFAFTEGMAMMLPGYVPFKQGIVYFTGVVEFLAAIGLLIPATRVFTAWFLVCFLVLLLPANIYAAMEQLDYQTGCHNGPDIGYLWFRIPLQMFFMAWIFMSAIKPYRIAARDCGD